VSDDYGGSSRDAPRGPRGSHRTPDPLDQERGRDGELPDGVQPLGVPTDRSGHNAFILSAAAAVALLALIFTLSWVVFNQLAPADREREQRQNPPTQSAPTTTPEPTLN
jgi:hypothetical protein